MIRFDPSTHTYSDPRSGEPVPGVSQLLSWGGWTPPLSGFVDPLVLEAARARGERLHSACLEGASPEILADDDELLRFEAWGRFVETYGFRPTFVEEAVYHDVQGERYAGRYDALGNLPDGKVVLLDLKTGSRVHSTTRFQLAAYRVAEKLPEDTLLWVVHLQKCGKLDVLDMTDEDAAPAFLGLARAWWERQALVR